MPPPDVDQTLPLQVWAGPLSGNRVVALLMNLVNETEHICATFGDLLYLPNGTTHVKVRDVIAHKELGVVSDQVCADVVSHGVAAYVLSP